MDEIPPTATLESPSAPKSTLGARLMNVFVAPTEVFDEVKAGPTMTANWVLPLALTIVVGIVAVFVIFSQPAVLQQMKEAREQAFQQAVATGKMSQKDADEKSAQIEKIWTPPLIKAFGIAGITIVNPIVLFAIGLFMFLVGKFALGGTFRYMQAVEATALAMVISVLGAIISMLLIVIYGNPTVTLGPVLFVKNIDPTNRVHAALAALNVFGIWETTVLSIGLARLAGTHLLKAAPWFFIAWAVIKFSPLLLIPAK